MADLEVKVGGVAASHDKGKVYVLPRYAALNHLHILFKLASITPSFFRSQVTVTVTEILLWQIWK